MELEREAMVEALIPPAAFQLLWGLWRESPFPAIVSEKAQWSPMIEEDEKAATPKVMKSIYFVLAGKKSMGMDGCGVSEWINWLGSAKLVHTTHVREIPDPMRLLTYRNFELKESNSNVNLPLFKSEPFKINIIHIYI